MEEALRELVRRKRRE
ncbi:MAG: hypothetical protein ACUZ8H_00720 [Candidatus Anammoxibacter sp.]